MLLQEPHLDLLQNNYEVDRLGVQTVGSKACTKSSIVHDLLYSHYQDVDDDASLISTTPSLRSDHSFCSDFSQRSDPPSPSKTSLTPSTDGAPESKAEHQEGNSTSESRCQMEASIAIDWSPSRQSRHRRTRSGNWNSDVLEAMPNQVPSEETCAWSRPSATGKSGQSSMQAAYFSFWSASSPTPPTSMRQFLKNSCDGVPISLPPLAEVGPIEEAEDEDEVPEEPVPMVPTGNSFTAATCTDGYAHDCTRSLHEEGQPSGEEGAN